MINSQLVLEQVTVDEATLESIVKTALVATLSYVTSTDQIVAFSVVSSRRRRLQQSTTTVAFSVRVAGSQESAASYAETIVSDLSTAAQSGALTTALNSAADDQGVPAPTAPAAANDYDTIMAATGGFLSGDGRRLRRDAGNATGVYPDYPAPPSENNSYYNSDANVEAELTVLPSLAVNETKPVQDKIYGQEANGIAIRVKWLTAVTTLPTTKSRSRKSLMSDVHSALGIVSHPNGSIIELRVC